MCLTNLVMASGGGPKQGNGGNKKGSSKSFTCPICKEVISDKSQASIFCSGVCQTVIHSGCGGPSSSALEDDKLSIVPPAEFITNPKSFLN